MAIRTDLPRLPAPTPTLFNTTASLMGLMAGGAAYVAASYFGAAAVTVGSLTLAAPLAGALAVGALGTWVGGMIGKSQMREQMRTGQPVREPSLFNRGLINGLFFGAAAVVGVLAAPAFGATLPTWMAGNFALGALGVLPATLVSTFTMIGDQKAFRAARHEADIISVTRQAEQARAKGLEQYLQAPAVTREEMAEIESRQKQGARGSSQSFVERVSAGREIADQALAK